MESIVSFLARTSSIDKATFTNQFSNPFLITSREKLQLMKNSTTVMAPKNKEGGFSTMISDKKNVEMESFWIKQGWVIPLVSKKGGGDMQMVNLGRTANNDIVIPLPVISKFHCCFMIYGSQEAFVIDGGSTNGTFLNGEKLEADSKTPISSRNLIRYGKLLEFEFYFPPDLWEDLELFRKCVQS